MEIWNELGAAQITISNSNLELLRNIYKQQPFHWKIEYFGSHRIPRGDELREKLSEIHTKAINLAYSDRADYRIYRDQLMAAFPGKVDLHYSGTEHINIRVYVMRS